MISAVSQAVGQYGSSEEELLRTLHFGLHQIAVAQRRERWLPGRLFNRISGENVHYVPLLGVALIQILSLISIDPPDAIESSGSYLLRRDLAAKAHTKLTEKVGINQVN